MRAPISERFPTQGQLRPFVALSLIHLCRFGFPPSLPPLNCLFHEVLEVCLIYLIPSRHLSLPAPLSYLHHYLIDLLRDPGLPQIT